ncbi:MAG: DNA polymerase IV [Gammaproteobacteria bacterium]|nr:DNA polymerase IV [Gammaproteobacteria bacterium]MDP2141947.1 DNA polymerase IV [Gammaproteobacteria bacterium]MDP2347171.1 DNA polymerase IV [Gammaproteobacteria bacterium]
MSAIRKIIHCDCDCFYASIETRDNPELRGLPVAVGGSALHRGVVATCNYEARKYGVHSAMPMATALRQCPNLIVIFPHMDKYREASRAVHAIFENYTALIEPLSLDEAYLDVTNADVFQGSATLIAQEIRRRVREEVGITISAGIAPNKFVAKIASDWNKPDGQFVVKPDEVDAFVKALPVKKIYGVGKVTAGRLNGMGIQTCADLRSYSEEELTSHFGSFGMNLYRLCRGIDEREVSTDRTRKSLSVENTYSTDLPSLETCLDRLPELHEQLLVRLQHVEAEYRITKKYVKLRFRDFVSTTVEAISSESEIAGYMTLCTTAYARGNRPVRLLGLGVKLEPLNAHPAGEAFTHNPRSRQLPLRLEIKQE